MYSVPQVKSKHYIPALKDGKKGVMDDNNQA